MPTTNTCPSCGLEIAESVMHGATCPKGADGFCCNADSMGDPCDDDCVCGGFAA